ncbi:hypothetical protein HID58_057510 [Brassica napus]|uniref:Uncharacterized protein n=1 Tax=Brassica napus TaxID=3708 RepID=A0ABQ8ARB0_BRANA|nr:hypothetical protein HID58_057510 [Brassica napus]
MAMKSVQNSGKSQEKTKP